MGIHSDQPHFNANSKKTFLVLGTGSASSIVFLAFDADDFEEYARNIHVTTTLALIILAFFNLLSRKEEIFKLIDDSEKFYDQSELVAHWSDQRHV